MQRVDRWLLIAAYVILVVTLAVATWSTDREVDDLKVQVHHLVTQVSEP